MTCFSILVCLPEDIATPKITALNEKRLRILLRTRNPRYFQRKADDGLEYHVALCDEDAIQFLNALPQPLYVKEIRYLYDPKWLLFSNRWLRNAQEPTVKPLTLVEKDVFWAAKTTERWTPRHKIETLQLREYVPA